MRYQITWAYNGKAVLFVIVDDHEAMLKKTHEILDTVHDKDLKLDQLHVEEVE